MLSDRHRILKILLLLVLLGILAVRFGHGALGNTYGYWKAMTNPDRYQGRAVDLALVTIEDVEPDRYVAVKVARRVPVMADTTGLKDGDVITFHGHFSATHQAVVEEWREVHRFRPLKWITSGLGVAFLAFYLPWSFRIRKGRLVLHA